MESRQHTRGQVAVETLSFLGRIGHDEGQSESISQQSHDESFVGCTGFNTHWIMEKVRRDNGE